MRIVPYGSIFKDDFVRLNRAWIEKRFELEEKDIEKSFQILPIPEAPWAENYRMVIEHPIDLSTIRVREWNEREV